ncbi:divalent-cation tolerance protein CutA [Pseudoalteromonas sp. T1lg65]|uniref:divalent-cation tolerance protein CutA n=1 Tax=Pseudoalteromonas sp. T1lg65 TaxID=2077101 RepID=UPI003F79B52F
MENTYKLVLSTCDSIEEARHLARELVEQKLAACVNLIPNIESFYSWQGQVEQSNETKLLIKTHIDKLQNTIDVLCELHSYEVPEVQVLDITGGNPDYFKWMDEVLR